MATDRGIHVHVDVVAVYVSIYELPIKQLNIVFLMWSFMLLLAFLFPCSISSLPFLPRSFSFLLVPGT